MEDALPVIKIVLQKGVGDCGLACLAMFLGRTYEDVLGAAVSYTKDKKIHQHGMWVTQITNTAKAMGVKLHRRKKWDLEEGCGILGMENTRTGEGHVVVLKNGMIFDTDGCVWSVGPYFANTKYKVTVILTRD